MPPIGPSAPSEPEARARAAFSAAFLRRAARAPGGASGPSSEGSPPSSSSSASPNGHTRPNPSTPSGRFAPRPSFRACRDQSGVKRCACPGCPFFARACRHRACQRGAGPWGRGVMEGAGVGRQCGGAGAPASPNGMTVWSTRSGRPSRPSASGSLKLSIDPNEPIDDIDRKRCAVGTGGRPKPRAPIGTRCQSSSVGSAASGAGPRGAAAGGDASATGGVSSGDGASGGAVALAPALAAAASCSGVACCGAVDGHMADGGAGGGMETWSASKGTIGPCWGSGGGGGGSVYGYAKPPWPSTLGSSPSST